MQDPIIVAPTRIDEGGARDWEPEIFSLRSADIKLWAFRIGTPPHDFLLPITDAPADADKPKCYFRLGTSRRGKPILRTSNAQHANAFLICCAPTSGFRGSAGIKLAEGIRELGRFRTLRSPRGALGVSEGLVGIVPLSQKARIEWTRSGRLYGAPSHWIAIYNGFKWLVVDAEHEDLIFLTK